MKSKKCYMMKMDRRKLVSVSIITPLEFNKEANIYWKLTPIRKYCCMQLCNIHCISTLALAYQQMIQSFVLWDQQQTWYQTQI